MNLFKLAKAVQKKLKKGAPQRLRPFNPQEVPEDERIGRAPGEIEAKHKQGQAHQSREAQRPGDGQGVVGVCALGHGGLLPVQP